MQEDSYWTNLPQAEIAEVILFEALSHPDFQTPVIQILRSVQLRTSPEIRGMQYRLEPEIEPDGSASIAHHLGFWMEVLIISMIH